VYTQLLIQVAPESGSPFQKKNFRETFHETENFRESSVLSPVVKYIFFSSYLNCNEIEWEK
jgi:hypothetical protein